MHHDIGTNINLMWLGKFCGILTAAHIYWGLHRDGIAAARWRFRVSFITSCGPWALSAQRQSFYSACSVVRLVFMFSADNARAPIASLTCFFCLFVFAAQTCPLPPAAPQSSSCTFERFMPTWSKRLPKWAHKCLPPFWAAPFKRTAEI